VRFEEAVADLTLTALEETTGGVLVFLPGEGEIRRVEARLAPRLPDGVAIRPLYGALPFADQRAAIRPDPTRRKVVLSTAIAETSLTIEDIRVVVDGGRARRARFDPGIGHVAAGDRACDARRGETACGPRGAGGGGRLLPALDQGRGRRVARLSPGRDRGGGSGGSRARPRALGGCAGDLAFLTPPNPGSYAEAQALLRLLGALDEENRITAHGKALATLPLHPRLAHMLSIAGKPAAPLAALLADRDPLPRAAPVDLSLRLAALSDPKGFAERSPHTPNRGAVERIRAEAKRLGARATPPKEALSPAAMAALAYPDRIGLRRAGDAPRYVLSGGKGAVLARGRPAVGRAADRGDGPRRGPARGADAAGDRAR
jgi:ATP-dependent helicase HrpB